MLNAPTKHDVPLLVRGRPGLGLHVTSVKEVSNDQTSSDRPEVLTTQHYI